MIPVRRTAWLSSSILILSACRVLSACAGHSHASTRQEPKERAGSATTATAGAAGTTTARATNAASAADATTAATAAAGTNSATGVETRSPPTSPEGTQGPGARLPPLVCPEGARPFETAPTGDPRTYLKRHCEIPRLDEGPGNGIRHGPMEFYMHGVKVGAEWYEQGGLRRAQNWMESGSPVSEMYWNSNGEGEGTWRMWSGSGQILREVPYVDGKVQAARARCYTEAGEEIPRCRRSVPESPEQRRWIRPEERTCRVDADCTAVRLPVDSCGCTMGAVNVRSLPRVRRLHRRLERLREQHPRNCLAVMDVCLGNSSACVQRRCQLEQVLYWLLE